MTTMYGSVKFKFVCESVRNDTLEIRFKNDGYYYKMVDRFLNEGYNAKYIWIEWEDGDNGERIIRLSGDPEVIEVTYEVLCVVVQTSHDAIDVIFDTIADAVRSTALNSKEENNV